MEEVEEVKEITRCKILVAVQVGRLICLDLEASSQYKLMAGEIIIYRELHLKSRFLAINITDPRVNLPVKPRKELAIST